MTHSVGTLSSIKGRLLRVNTLTGQLVKNDVSGNGTPNGTGVVAYEYGDDVVHKTILRCTATPITVTDEGGVSQWGGAGKVYDFPDGGIILVGAICSGLLTLGTTGTITANWAGIASLGTVAASATGAASLVTTAAAWLQSFAIGAATAKVATIDGMSVSTQLVESSTRDEDGTDTAVDMFFNIKVTDEGTHTSGTGEFTGTINFVWINLGDN